VQGEQEIVYTNHSPDPLTSLVFRLYMNAHHPSAMREKPVDARFLTQGISVEQFSIDGKTVAWDDPADPLATTTPRQHRPRRDAGRADPAQRQRAHPHALALRPGRRQGLEGRRDRRDVLLPRLLLPARHQLQRLRRLGLRALHPGPGVQQRLCRLPRGGGRAARLRGLGHRHAAEPGRGAAAGCSANWRPAASSDEVVTLALAADAKAGKVTARGERLVWKWQAENVPDFAIALSNHYRWDAASTVVDPASGRRASVQAAYPDSATDFKPAVARRSRRCAFASTAYPGVPYPYPKTTIVLGSADEEYPMMVNDGSNVGDHFAATLPENAYTGFVAAHEILHSWFPFYMGINEKRYPFMDEGWTTAFEYLRNREVMGVTRSPTRCSRPSARRPWLCRCRAWICRSSPRTIPCSPRAPSSASTSTARPRLATWR
jgi:hypothetical protein